MDVQVAVDTSSVIHARGDCAARGGIRTKVMPGIGMALLAEAGHLNPEQVLEVRAVRLVTIHTILQDRRMRPQERSALCGVATCAFLVDGDRRDQLFGRCPVRVVAARADDLSAFPTGAHGHVRRPAELHGPYPVALAA